jgi:hypothetical protein
MDMVRLIAVETMGGEGSQDREGHCKDQNNWEFLVCMAENEVCGWVRTYCIEPNLLNTFRMQHLRVHMSHLR